MRERGNSLLKQLSQLCLGKGHVFLEFGRCLEAGITDTGYGAAGVYVALPVATGDNAAFA